MVEPKPASTVVLLRDSGVGPQTYLMRRHRGMDFAGGAHVFPGGRVDPFDLDESIPWAGPTPAEWAATMGCSTEEARGHVSAAIREMFEETGVLLAGASVADVVADTTGPEWESTRAALESKDISFAQFLNERGLLLRSDLLRYWGRRITPEVAPKRYDTRFFVSMLPAEQAPRDVSTEADQVSWVTVAEALAQADRDEIVLLPPTYQTCLDLVPYSNVELILEAALVRMEGAS